MTVKPTKQIQYLLVGLPYSGKTTMANYLKNKYGFAHINIDQLKKEAGYGDVGDDDVPDVVWDKIFIAADNLIVKYLSQGKNLANEYAWVTREWRDRAKKVAKDIGFETKIIYLTIDLKEIKKRWLKNSKTKERFHWPKNEFKNYIHDFEKPTEDEHVIEYDQTVSIDKWVQENISS